MTGTETEMQSKSLVSSYFCITQHTWELLLRFVKKTHTLDFEFELQPCCWCQTVKVYNDHNLCINTKFILLCICSASAALRALCRVSVTHIPVSWWCVCASTGELTACEEPDEQQSDKEDKTLSAEAGEGTNVSEKKNSETNKHIMHVNKNKKYCPFNKYGGNIGLSLIFNCYFSIW